MPTPNNHNYVSLKDRIAEACRWSKSQPGTETHLSLKGGLHIWIGYLAVTKAYTLRLGRQHVQPSNVEWKTVIANWIWNAHAQAGASTAPPHWNYLSANIPDREIKQETLF